jgi:sulfate transport system substrate-binding protein
MHSPNRSTSTKWLNALAITAAISAVSAVAWKNSQPSPPAVALNASGGPAPQLLRDLNNRFAQNSRAEAGPAAARSQPCTSTIVFLVRKGNPKSIRDWPDLVRKDVIVAAPDPKTSGAGKLSVLAAWGSVVHRGGTPAGATEYLSQLYARKPVPDETFTKGGVGDILLTWENQALDYGARGDYEIVYPPVSILAEPAVAGVGPEGSTRAYLQFLFTAPAQEIIAQHGYRPADQAVFKKYAKRFPAIDLFPVTAIARDWDDADRKFFADGGIYSKVRDQSRPVLTARK